MISKLGLLVVLLCVAIVPASVSAQITSSELGGLLPSDSFVLSLDDGAPY